jgi:hypothetical protein
MRTTSRTYGTGIPEAWGGQGFLGQAMRSCGDACVLLGEGVIAAIRWDAPIATIIVKFLPYTVEALRGSTALIDEAVAAVDFLVNSADSDGNGDMFGNGRGAIGGVG